MCQLTTSQTLCFLLLQVMQSTLSPSTFRLLTSILRTVNNVLGGISFVVLAKVFGVQSSAGDEKKTCAKALPVAAKEH